VPDQFNRVQSWIGSFTAIQWQERPDVIAGGQDFPDMVLRGPKRNIRIWSQDGANDQEKERGSWPLDNIRMANALKLSGYDYPFRFLLTQSVRMTTYCKSERQRLSCSASIAAGLSRTPPHK
jgi:hypothetical protein